MGADGRTDTASLMKFITHMQKVPNKKWLQNKVDARKSWQAFKKSVLHDCSLEKRMRTSKIIRMSIYSFINGFKALVKGGGVSLVGFISSITDTHVHTHSISSWNHI